MSPGLLRITGLSIERRVTTLGFVHPDQRGCPGKRRSGVPPQQPLKCFARPIYSRTATGHIQYIAVVADTQYRRNVRVCSLWKLYAERLLWPLRVLFTLSIYAKCLRYTRKFYLLHIRTYILLLVCTDRSLCELKSSIPRKNIIDSRKCPPNGAGRR